MKRDAADGPHTLAIVCDFVEEGWHSMDLAAEMLHDASLGLDSTGLATTLVRPDFRSRFAPSRRGGAFNVDRLLNRFWDYPRYLRRRVAPFDFVHVADHSYAHLVHVLPAETSGVFCHDLDAFRCLLEPEREPRPAWFRAMARRVLTGLQRAAVVFYSTHAVRDSILERGLVEPSRLVHAPYGVAPEFTADPAGSTSAAVDGPYVLHVGSCIARKRIDVLLDVFARVRATSPGLRLVHAGGPFADEHRDRIRRLGIEGAVVDMPRLERSEIADLYRRSELVLLTSDAEGFGLPVIEALACGARVVASDLPVLREVGGDQVTYAPVADVDVWTSAVNGVLADDSGPEGLHRRLERADMFSWSAHARIVLETYAALS